MSMSSNSDKLRCLCKSYLTNRDIACLLEVGVNRAAEIRKEFLVRHKTLTRVPTDLFVKENRINEERIIKFASLE